MAFGPQGYNQTIACIRKQGVLYNTYTTSKSMLTSATAVVDVSDQVPNLSAGFFYPGKKMKIRFVAGISNRVTGPDTFTIEVKVGAVVAFTTGVITLTTTVHTTIPLWGDIDLTCDTAGSGTLAKLRGQARLSGQMIQQGGTAAADSTTLSNTILMPNAAPVLGTGFDSSIVNTLDFWVAQSFSGAGNGFQLWEYEVIDCN